MAMVVSMAVVIPEDPAIIGTANARIYVSQAVLHQFGATLENLLFDSRPSPFTRQMTNVDRRSARDGALGLLPHRVILSQVEQCMFTLGPVPLALARNIRRNES